MLNKFIAIFEFDIVTDMDEFNDRIENMDAEHPDQHVLINTENIETILIDFINTRNGDKDPALKIYLSDNTCLPVFSKQNDIKNKISELLEKQTDLLNYLNNENSEINNDIENDSLNNYLKQILIHRRNRNGNSANALFAEISQAKAHVRECCKKFVDAFSIDDENKKIEYANDLADWLIQNKEVRSNLIIFLENDRIMQHGNEHLSKYESEMIDNLNLIYHAQNEVDKL